MPPELDQFWSGTLWSEYIGPRRFFPSPLPGRYDFALEVFGVSKLSTLRGGGLGRLEANYHHFAHGVLTGGRGGRIACHSQSGNHMLRLATEQPQLFELILMIGVPHLGSGLASSLNRALPLLKLVAPCVQDLCIGSPYLSGVAEQYLVMLADSQLDGVRPRIINIALKDDRSIVTPYWLSLLPGGENYVLSHDAIPDPPQGAMVIRTQGRIDHLTAVDQEALEIYLRIIDGEYQAKTPSPSRRIKYVRRPVTSMRDHKAA